MREALEERVRELGRLSDAELTQIAEQAESKVEILEDQREGQIKQRYYVK